MGTHLFHSLAYCRELSQAEKVSDLKTADNSLDIFLRVSQNLGQKIKHI